MTPQEFAAKLDGRDEGEEIRKKEIQEAANLGLVVVYGSSDDLMEFRGYINDEVGAYEGAVARIDKNGVIPEWDDVDHDDIDKCRKFFELEKSGRQIEAIWDCDGYLWIYKTDIPHATFDIMDAERNDGEKYCRGIVFSILDL